MQACRKAAGALASTSLPAAEALRGALPAVAQRFYHKNVRSCGLVACGTQGQHDCMLRIRHSAAEAENRARECSSIACWCCVRRLHLVQSLRSPTVRSLGACGRDSGMLLFIQESTKSESAGRLFPCLFTVLSKGCRWLSCAPKPEAAVRSQCSARDESGLVALQSLRLRVRRWWTTMTARATWAPLTKQTRPWALAWLARQRAGTL